MTLLGRPPPSVSKPPIERYFRVLGLAPTASHDDVRKAGRNGGTEHGWRMGGQWWVKQWKKAAAEIKFREVAEAYDKVCEHLRQK
eukprot:Skav230622  [mRNA]  locus=scaffold1673:88369:89263:+ [translate_table: standard]